MARRTRSAPHTAQVLGCKYVGDVVIDPPWHLTREMIAALHISVVAHGTTQDDNDDNGDPYEVPKAMGIFCRLPSQRALTVDVVFARVHANHERLAKKVDRKQAGERDYYARRYGFGDDGGTEQGAGTSS